MKPQGVIPGKDDPPKDKNRRAVGRIIGVSLLPPLCGSNKWYWLPGVTPVGSPPAIIPSHLRCFFISNHKMIRRYAKHLPFHYTNHQVLQADEIDASGIGLHRKAESVKKHCPSFSKRLPIKIKNVAHSFGKPWATNFNPMGNKFCAGGQRIVDLQVSLYSPFSICS